MQDRLNIQSITGADLDHPIAGPGGRSYAFIIDWHIRFIVATAWYFVVFLIYAGTKRWFDGSVTSPTTFFYIAGLPATVIYFLYHPILEIFMDGRTPGKRIAGVRIVTRDGHSPDVVAHLIRNVFRLVDSMPFGYIIGFTTTLFTDNSVRFGDLAAGTLLIYDAADEKKAFEEVSAAVGKDIGLEEAELVRELMDRWDALDSEVRQELGRKLLNRVNPGKATASSDNGILAQLKTYLKEA
jgi:uncharacterized RDD family membrane protein YckC